MAQKLNKELINQATKVLEGGLQPLIKDLIIDIKSDDVSNNFSSAIEAMGIKELFEAEASLRVYEEYQSALSHSIRSAITSRLNEYSDVEYKSTFSSELFEELKGVTTVSTTFSTIKGEKPEDHINDSQLMDTLYDRKLNTSILKEKLNQQDKDVVNLMGKLINSSNKIKRDIVWKLK